LLLLGNIFIPNYLAYCFGFLRSILNSSETVSLFRPFLLLAARTFRPPAVALLGRKPNFFNLLPFFGCQVLFIICWIISYYFFRVNPNLLKRFLSTFFFEWVSGWLAYTGREIEKVDPLPSELETEIFPPISLIRLKETYNPKP